MIAPHGRPADRRWLPVVLVLGGVAAASLYANFILDWILRGFAGMSLIVSSLEAPGQPNAAIMRLTDVACALLMLALLRWVRLAMPEGFWRELCIAMMVIFALGSVVAAIVATPCGPGVACDGPGQQAQIEVHDVSSIVSDTALYAAVASAWFSVRTAGPRWFARTAWWLFWLGGIASSIVFEYFNTTQDPLWAVGASQRVHILSISAWILALALLAARTPPPRADRKAGTA